MGCSSSSATPTSDSAGTLAPSQEKSLDHYNLQLRECGIDPAEENSNVPVPLVVTFSSELNPLGTSDDFTSKLSPTLACPKHTSMRRRSSGITTDASGNSTSGQDSPPNLDRRVSFGPVQVVLERQSQPPKPIVATSATSAALNAPLR